MDESQLLALIGTTIRSVWALELLLVMKRRPEQPWATAALVQELRASTPLVESALGQLIAGGLIRQEEQGFVYGPASPMLVEAVEALDRAYRERPVKVVNLIVGTSTNVQGFADAFRFRKKEE